MAIVPSAGRAQSITSFTESATASAPFTEAVSSDPLYDPQHTSEDIGWSNLTSDGLSLQTGLDFTAADRRNQVARARHYWRTYPLAKQAIRLYVTYVLGQGVSYHCDNPQVQETLDAFWNDYDNRLALTSSQAQKSLMTRQRVDGEVFLYLFTDPASGRVKVRVGEPLEIQDIISDPEDTARPHYYKREWTPQKYNFTTGTMSTAGGGGLGQLTTAYYADIANNDLADKPDENFVDKAVVLHDKINAMGQRGVSDLYAALDWLSAHRTFMEDVATFMHAKARIAWVKKVRGGPNAINSSAALTRSTAAGPFGASVGGYEHNPPVPSGSDYVSTPAADITGLKMDSGVGEAETGGRLLMTQVGAATGIMLHYFGDGGDANLATATAMDLPMQKLFESGQDDWKGLFQRVFDYVILQAVKAGTITGEVEEEDGRERAVLPDVPRTKMNPDGTQSTEQVASDIFIDFPLIVARDTWAMTQSIGAMRQQGGISKMLYIKQCLTLLGVDDMDDELKDALGDQPPTPIDPNSPDALQAKQDAALAVVGAKAGQQGQSATDAGKTTQKPSRDATARSKPQTPTAPPQAAANAQPGTKAPRATQVAKGGIKR